MRRTYLLDVKHISTSTQLLTRKELPLTYHGEDVGVIHGASVVLRRLHVLTVDDEGEGEAEVGAEHVDEHRPADIRRLEKSIQGHTTALLLR